MPYTIINLFNVGDPDNMECFVAHYEKKEDAVRAFGELLTARKQLREDESAEKTFDALLDSGCGYNPLPSADNDWYFVRQQPVQHSFDIEKLPVEAQGAYADGSWHEANKPN